MGDGTPYHYLVQLSTALLLVLAANTAFNGFPRLPRSSRVTATGRASSSSAATASLQHRHRRAHGAGVAILIMFHASVTNLIPLYTVGVFVAFTLSQSGHGAALVAAPRRRRGWRRRAAVNGVGAVATGVVAIVVGVSSSPSAPGWSSPGPAADGLMLADPPPLRRVGVPWRSTVSERRRASPARCGSWCRSVGSTVRARCTALTRARSRSDVTAGARQRRPADAEERRSRRAGPSSTPASLTSS